MKIQLLIVLVLILFVGCQKEDLPANTVSIVDQTFENGLRVDGVEYNGLLIENCRFENRSLRIGNAKDIIIRNCTFENISFDGIKLGFIGDVENITIEDCTFKNIGYNGIDSHEDAPDCTIRNCRFENTALSEIGAALAQPHHAIYWKGRNVTITGNTFIAGSQPFGNCISVRSSGLISGNKIFDSPKNGIMYYANHPGGDSLIIENNFVVNSKFYSIIAGSDNNLSNHNKNVVIRFNSCVQQEEHSIYISEVFETTTDFYIYGNILVNSSNQFFRTFYPVDNIFQNLTSTSDIGFAAMENGDLHLLTSSQANGFCDGLTDFPNQDIDGDTRSSTNLDAGADEIN